MPASRWLLLTHQLPDKPSNIRVKVWRKLQTLGAVAIKNSIYALPNRPSTREDFEWLRKEINQSGGEANVFSSDSISEQDDREIIRGFQDARAKEYGAFAKTIEAFNEKVSSAIEWGHVKGEALDKFERQWTAHKLDWERLSKIDFFKAANRAAAAGALARGQKLLNRAKAVALMHAPEPPPFISPKQLKGMIWVTRISPHIDRLASAWLVRRFVDTRARFKFVKTPYPAREGEVRFDMPEGEFTHFGDWCTFETLIRRLGLREPALTDLAEIIHDIDLKDRKFSRPEASGLSLAIRGLCRKYGADSARLEAGIVFFDGVYAALCAETSR